MFDYYYYYSNKCFSILILALFVPLVQTVALNTFKILFTGAIYGREAPARRLELRHCLAAEQCQSQAWKKEEGDTKHLRYGTVSLNWNNHDFRNCISIFIVDKYNLRT